MTLTKAIFFAVALDFSKKYTLNQSKDKKIRLPQKKAAHAASATIASEEEAINNSTESDQIPTHTAKTENQISILLRLLWAKTKLPKPIFKRETMKIKKLRTSIQAQLYHFFAE